MTQPEITTILHKAVVLAADCDTYRDDSSKRDQLIERMAGLYWPLSDVLDLALTET